jgi:hypothetical protein
MKTRYSWSTVATTDESTTAPVALLAICISLAPLRGTRFAECAHQSRRARMPRYFVRHPGGGMLLLVSAPEWMTILPGRPSASSF